MSVIISVLHTLQFLFRSRAVLHLQILALRHQLAVANRSRGPRLRFTTMDRLLWAWLWQRWRGWKGALHVVQPATVLAWQGQVEASAERIMHKSPVVPSEIVRVRELRAWEWTLIIAATESSWLPRCLPNCVSGL